MGRVANRGDGDGSVSGISGASHPGSQAGGVHAPPWESVVSAATGTPPPIPPNIPKDAGDPYVTLNVDGGVTNNDPFNYSHDYLVALAPKAIDKSSEDPATVDRAVIGIAPFPTTDTFDPDFNAKTAEAVLSALPAFLGADFAVAVFRRGVERHHERGKL